MNYNNLKTRKKINIKKLILPFLIILFLVYFFIYRPFVNIKAKANIVMASAKELKAVFAKNDIVLLKTKLNDFSV
ncbi:MAG TPA: hypothetical protein VF385_02745, partial [Patescibacteria group bacterium]